MGSGRGDWEADAAIAPMCGDRGLGRAISGRDLEARRDDRWRVRQAASRSKSSCRFGSRAGAMPGDALGDRRHPEVREDLRHHVRLIDDGENLHPAAALGAGQNVDLKNSLQERRPIDARGFVPRQLLRRLSLGDVWLRLRARDGTCEDGERAMLRARTTASARWYVRGRRARDGTRDDGERAMVRARTASARWYVRQRRVLDVTCEDG